MTYPVRTFRTTVPALRQVRIVREEHDKPQWCGCEDCADDREGLEHFCGATLYVYLGTSDILHCDLCDCAGGRREAVRLLREGTG